VVHNSRDNSTSWHVLYSSVYQFVTHVAMVGVLI
jgi:hypothetical protein